jgi:hypothetical protein
MVPSQMKDFSESLVAVSLFASNILFWHESGYFAAAAEEKPLLHTWSLAVEEQYYVLFPIFLIIIWRFGKNRVFWTIVVMAAISLLLSEWGWRNKATANFYLAPTRAWELFAGSITAFIVQKQGVQKNNFLALLGLVAITFAIFAYDESTPFPSLYALVPVLGGVILILYAEKETFAAKLLSTKAFVGIGLISYSAYLWHQPLFAFARIRLLEHPSSLLMLALSALSLFVAYFSWLYIEKPFRNSQSISKLSVFLISIFFICLFITLGLIGNHKKGFPLMPDPNGLVNVDIPVYVIGDSHAQHLISGLEELNTDTVEDMTSAGCIPFRNVDRYDSRFEVGACARTMNAHLDEVKTIDTPSIVILSSMGPVYLDGTTFNGKDEARVTGLGVELISDYTISNHYDVFEIGMRTTLNEFSNNPNLYVIFALDIPELGIDEGCGSEGKNLFVFGYEVGDYVVSKNFENCYVSRESYDERTKRYKELLHRVLKDYPEVYVFDPTNYFCNKDVCKGFVPEFGYLYRDFDHLSESGSLYYADRLFSNFQFPHNE